MSENSQDEEKAPRESMRRFLHFDAIGCRFARDVISSENRTAWQVVGDGLPPERVITDLFSAAEQRKKFAAAILPRVSSVAALQAVLRALATLPRWVLEERTEIVSGIAVPVVSLFWKTEDGERSNVMGMAPLLSMPPTRRAPYVALFAWPAARANDFRKHPRDDIGIGDTPPADSLNATTYSDLFKATKQGSQRLNGPTEPPLNATFIL